MNDNIVKENKTPCVIKPLNTLFNIFWKVAGAVFIPKGILLYIQCPSLLLNAVLSVSLGSISI